MLKKTIKYVDFNDNEREEDFFFNLSKSELMEWEMSVDGGLSEKMKQIVNKKSAPEIMATFKEIILKSYGEKSADGKRFIKSKELSEEFMQSGAYDVLFMELLNNSDTAVAFINGIIPPEAKQKAVPDSVAK